MNCKDLTERILDKRLKLEMQIQNQIESEVLPMLKDNKVKNIIKEALGISLHDQNKLIAKIYDNYYELFRCDVSLETITDMEKQLKGGGN